MEDLAGKTLSIYLDINKYRYVFLAIIEGEIDQEFNHSNIIYRYESFQIPSEKTVAPLGTSTVTSFFSDTL